MADDETPKAEPEIVAPVAGPLPSREPRHDPGVIEGEAHEIHAAAPEEAEPVAEADQAADGAVLQDPAPEEPIPEEPASPEPDSAAAPPARAGWLFFAALLGALVGAVVAFAAAWFLDSRSGDLDAVNLRLTGLQRQADAESETNAALDKRLRALEANEAGAAKAIVLDAIGRRVATLEGAAAKNDAAKNGTAQSALEEARAARADAAKALALAGSAPAGQSTAPAASGGAPAAFDPSALEARIGKLESDLAALKASADLGPVDDRLAKLETALAAPKTQGRVAASTTSPAGGAGAAVLAMSLVERLDAGAPYAPELAALARLGTDDAKLAALKPFAETGAPTLAALRAAFAKASPAIAAAIAPPEQSGVLDRLMDHMRKLVRVHAVGETASDDPEGLTSRITAALARGDLATALEAYGRLPEAARSAAGEWAKLTQARQSAGEAAAALRADAVGRLAAAKD